MKTNYLTYILTLSILLQGCITTNTNRNKTGISNQEIPPEYLDGLKYVEGTNNPKNYWNYGVADFSLTTKMDQLDGEQIDHVKLSIGESVRVFVRGRSSKETGSKWFVLSRDTKIYWEADENIELVPKEGFSAIITLKKKTNKSAYVKVSLMDTNDKLITHAFTIERI